MAGDTRRTLIEPRMQDQPLEAIDAAFAELSDSLDGTGLIALEAGLAVEV